MSNAMDLVGVSDKRARVTLRVQGDVQGVGYRFYVRKVAAGLSVAGWVRNESDGSVSIVAEGPVDHLNKLLEAASEGPATADVDEVEASWSRAFGDFEGFHVKLW